jgi:hypothetical protein
MNCRLFHNIKKQNKFQFNKILPNQPNHPSHNVAATTTHLLLAINLTSLKKQARRKVKARPVHIKHPEKKSPLPHSDTVTSRGRAMLWGVGDIETKEHGYFGVVFRAEHTLPTANY